MTLLLSNNDVERALVMRDCIDVLEEAYRELGELFAFFSGFHIANIDDITVERFQELKLAKSRVGTMDLKIAAIALAHNALLLTANRRDFEKIPNLRFENWLTVG